MTKIFFSLFALAQATGPAAAEFQLDWALTQGELVTAVVWSHTNSRIAVATGNAIKVMDVAGKSLWQWNLQETSRFLRPPGRSYGFSSLAISPGCDVVVLAGDSGYKYVWAAHQSGKRAFLKTTGTPMHVAFDLRGRSVAVATAAGHGYLVSPLLITRWSGKLRGLPIRWPNQAPSSVGPKATEFTRHDVERLMSVPPWGYFVSDRVSEDGAWRVMRNGPFRGAQQLTTFDVWGPQADGFHGRYDLDESRTPRWSKAMGCLEVEMARDGMFVIADGDPDHPEHNMSRADTCLEQHPRHVFDRDGKLVLTWPVDGDRDEMAAAVLARTGKPLVLEPVSRPALNLPDDSAHGLTKEVSNSASAEK
ncbi:MAG: hypothetical protein ACRD2N_20285 [Vicinamibacterales bacterium]